MFKSGHHTDVSLKPCYLKSCCTIPKMRMVIVPWQISTQNATKHKLPWQIRKKLGVNDDVREQVGVDVFAILVFT